MNKLSFGDVLGESFRFFFGNVRLFFHLVTIPWLVSVAIRVLGASLGQGEDMVLLTLFEKLLDVVPSVMFLVAWMRVVLLGPERVDGLPGLGWSRRETAFLIHLIQIGGVMFLLVSALMLTAGTIDPVTLGASPSADPDIARRQALIAPLGAGFITSALLVLRVSYGLAASAVDVPFSPRLSWIHGKGNGWTIVATLVVMFFVNAIATSLAALLTVAILRGLLGTGLGPAVVAWTVAILVSYGGAALVATTQATMFRQLLRWREGAALPPP